MLVYARRTGQEAAVDTEKIILSGDDVVAKEAEPMPLVDRVERLEHDLAAALEYIKSLSIATDALQDRMERVKKHVGL
jgi:enoyl-CoA hydratase/carnithine racemase